MNHVLMEMLSTRTTRTSTGDVVPLRFHVLPTLAESLYRTVRAERPTDVVEVGMAYGVSTLAILSALEDNGAGRLVSIDPFQSADYHASGVAAVARSGLAHRHTLMERPDYLALPELLADGRVVQFGYVDGSHTFEAALLDFLYLDRMLTVGGLVAFNDCSMPAVHKVLNYVLTHRRYSEIDVGLPPMRGWQSRRLRAIHGVAQLLGMPMNPAGAPREADRYFRKCAAYEPAWDFYEPF